MEKLFTLLDRNNDGVVDRSEFQELMRRAGSTNTMSAPQLQNKGSSITVKLLEDVRTENDRLNKVVFDRDAQLHQQALAIQLQAEALASAEAELAQERCLREDLENQLRSGASPVPIQSPSTPSPQPSPPEKRQIIDQFDGIDIVSLYAQLDEATNHIEQQAHESEQLQADLMVVQLALSQSQREVANIQREVGTTALLGAQLEVAPKPLVLRTNHAGCWVRQCLVQWHANRMIASRKHLKNCGIRVAARIAGSLITSTISELTLQMWLHWRALVHISRTAEWHLQLQEDAHNFLKSEQSGWQQGVRISFAQSTFYSQQAALVRWHALVCQVKLSRVVLAAESPELAHILQLAVERSGPERVKQVLSRWLNSVRYCSLERSEMAHSRSNTPAGTPVQSGVMLSP